MDASKILFRCSSLGHLMTEPKSKADKEAGNLSESAKTHLIDVYVSNQYNRFTEINGKFLDKGNDCEEDSITTISRITKTFYKKNEEHLENEFIKGTPDLYEGESIASAEVIRDAKSSWDIYTFHRAISKDLDDKYYWQGTGYMWLTGAKKCFIDYCLNNTPYHLVNRELLYESYKQPEGDTPGWIELQIIANHVYDRATLDKYIAQRGIKIEGEYAEAVYNGFVEVPVNKRHYAFAFERNDDDIERLKARIIKGREYIEGLESMFHPSVLLASHDTEVNSTIVQEA